MMEAKAAKEPDKQRPIFRDIRRYFCEHCGICRSKKSLLRSHILSHHKDELHKVKLDEVDAFKEASQKVQHTCEDCGASFWKPAYLVQHMRSHSVEAFGSLIVIYQKKKKNCIEERASIGSHDELQNAKRWHPFLDWTSIRMGDLLRSSIMKASIHALSHPGEDCYLRYRRKDHLNRHLLKHEGKVFDCPVQSCNHTFAFQGNMTRHVKEIHDDDYPVEGEKQYVCDEPGCGKTFKFASKLKKHEDSHVRMESVELFCGEPQCMKPFTNSECLKAHIQSCHKYVKCEVCGTQQLRKNFKRHQRAHEGAVSMERIKCSFRGCEQTFSKKSNLNKHVKAVHEELRPFKCRTSGCQRRFPYKHVRDNHEKTHVYEQGNFLEADEEWRSRPRGGRKRERITIETLTRKRVVPLDHSFVMEDGAEYLRWMLADDD